MVFNLYILLALILLFVVLLIDSVLRDILNLFLARFNSTFEHCMLRIQMLSSFFALLLADLARSAVIY